MLVALRYHIKVTLNKPTSLQDFKMQLNHLIQREDFDNATKTLIREIEGGLPPDESPKTRLDIEVLTKRQEEGSDLKMEQRIKAMIDEYLPPLKLDEK
ncbi:hypothetical protein [Helicobacter mehlei]|nr:hypothetical protein [Helicobacter mehlei]